MLEQLFMVVVSGCVAFCEGHGGCLWRGNVFFQRTNQWPAGNSRSGGWCRCMTPELSEILRILHQQRQQLNVFWMLLPFFCPAG
ncbi:hypothetical protein SynRCC2555_01304 [Synechococcus sp. WH 8101]|nr:hypothetical protein SynRCC2555_01304 [Synechococcus sp. WH 8101]